MNITVKIFRRLGFPNALPMFLNPLKAETLLDGMPCLTSGNLNQRKGGDEEEWSSEIEPTHDGVI